MKLAGCLKFAFHQSPFLNLLLIDESRGREEEESQLYLTIFAVVLIRAMCDVMLHLVCIRYVFSFSQYGLHFSP